MPASVLQVDAVVQGRGEDVLVRADGKLLTPGTRVTRAISRPQAFTGSSWDMSEVTMKASSST